MTSLKHDYANYDRLVPNFDMTYKTIKRVSVPEISSHLDQRKQSYGQKKLENFLLRYMRKWAGGVLLPTIMALTI